MPSKSSGFPQFASGRVWGLRKMAFRFKEMRGRADEEEKKIFDDIVEAFEKAGIIEAIDVSMLDDDDLAMFFNNSDTLVIAKKFRDLAMKYRHGWAIGFDLSQAAVPPPPTPVVAAKVIPAVRSGGKQAARTLTSSCIAATRAFV